MPIFDAAMQYQKEGVPLIVVAGKEYGSGSSRAMGGKGPRLLGIKAADHRELPADSPRAT